MIEELEIHKKDRVERITKLRTCIINNLVDNEIHLEDIDYIIEEFINHMNEYLKGE